MECHATIQFAFHLNVYTHLCDIISQPLTSFELLSDEIFKQSQL